jgi:hypothetical protein
MGKVTWEGWQKDASNAATPTGPVTLRADWGRFAATPKEQNEFARKHPGETVICLTLPPAKATPQVKPARRRPASKR